jgi:hypothetical protein
LIGELDDGDGDRENEEDDELVGLSVLSDGVSIVTSKSLGSINLWRYGIDFDSK